MEKPEENTEKKEETTETAKKSMKIDGISSQINLVPNSPRHRQFARLMTASGLDSPNEFMQLLMDSYETPHTDNSEAIEELQNQLDAITKDRDELNDICNNQKNEISDLKKKLESAYKNIDENANYGLGKQLQLDELQKKMEGAILVHPNPVSRYFLDEMAQKQNTTPGKILERLFIDDLQNPRANNLPYTVASSRIREVMDELKPKTDA